MLLRFCFQDISEDDDLDWWSKYFGSKNKDDDEIEKCGSFLEKGHKAIQVSKFWINNVIDQACLLCDYQLSYHEDYISYDQDIICIIYGFDSVIAPTKLFLFVTSF